jgi:glycosyltransferase involved in cell wall biosynthesis
VIDAQSTDGTIDYLQTFTAPFYWISEPDKGVYDAMNKGIDMSKGNWLFFLGCDDLFYDNKTLESIFSETVNDDISLIIGKVQYDFSSRDSLMIKKNKGLFEPSWSKKMWLKNTLHHQGVFYKRELFSIQKYALNYQILSDYDFNLKMFRSNKKVQIINQIISISRTEGISKNYNWQLYKEEIDLKTRQSSLLFKPFFYLLGTGKFLLKKII